MRSLLALALCVCFSSTPEAIAKGDRLGKGLGLKKVLGELNLSEEQKKKIKNLKKTYKDNGKDLKKQVKAARNALAEGWKSQADDKKMKDLHEAFHKATAKKINHRFESMLAVRNLLTKEQKILFAEKMGQSKMEIDVEMKFKKVKKKKK